MEIMEIDSFYQISLEEITCTIAGEANWRRNKLLVGYLIMAIYHVKSWMLADSKWLILYMVDIYLSNTCMTCPKEAMT